MNTTDEIKILGRKLLERVASCPNHCGELKEDLHPKVNQALLWLVNKGYGKVGNTLLGPLGIPTGTKCLTPTKAGHLWLAEN